MKKYHYTAVLVCLLFMTGCSQSKISGEINENMSSRPQENISSTTIFVSGMGCSDPSCTDSSHHHDCPPDCGDYDHHHYCDLDCSEVSHHHADIHHESNQYTDSTADASVSFVSGMGCSDPSCTDPSHHHDCPPDCGDYDHHHYCDLDCSEVSHHHADIHHESNQYTDSTADASISFVSGMGCSDPSCTDPSHHHDCPPDCGDYDHHHYCDLDCTEVNHHHNGTSKINESGQHHSKRHHGGNHH